MNTTATGTAAAQEAAATTTQTVATATTSTETGNTATAAKPIFKKRTPPKKRMPSAPKARKEPKRVTGTLIYLATISNSHWRMFVSEIVNGTSAEEKHIARFVQDESAKGTKWGGYIACNPENKDAVLAILNKWTAENNAKPAAEQCIDLWKILDHFQEVTPTPKARRTKEEIAAAKAEKASTEATTETTETSTEATD